MKKQSGSAHVIIVIVLVIALLGSLGFIFWQNFAAKDSDTKSDEKQTIKQEDKKKEVSSEEAETTKKAEVIEEDDYSFTVVDGFKKSTKQMFIYSGSLKAVNTFMNDDGDYFEILVPRGGGGGFSADYFWRYTTEGSKISIKKADRCQADEFACTADNSSVEGIIFSSAEQDRKYYLAFGNKTKNDIDLAFVDEFISTFSFK